MKGIQRLADAMLARFVPEAKAAAIDCFVITSECTIQYCCFGALVPGGEWCGPSQRIC